MQFGSSMLANGLKREPAIRLQRILCRGFFAGDPLTVFGSKPTRSDSRLAEFGQQNLGSRIPCCPRSPSPDSELTHYRQGQAATFRLTEI